MRCLYSAVSLSLVSEQHFIRIIYYYCYYYTCVLHSYPYDVCYTHTLTCIHVFYTHTLTCIHVCYTHTLTCIHVCYSHTLTCTHICYTHMTTLPLPVYMCTPLTWQCYLPLPVYMSATHLVCYTHVTVPSPGGARKGRSEREGR